MASHFSRRGAGARATRFGIIAVIALGLVAFGIVKATPDHKSLVVGKFHAPRNTVPTVTVPLPDIGRAPLATPARSASLLGANGTAYGKALAFHSNIPIKEGLVFVLVVGSDARPGQDLHKTRTDSLHVVAIDPATRSGTIVGIPRDTWVNIPGKGEAKINTAMGSGGPQLLMQTVRNFTGLPIEYYVLTGFEGFAEMVDELGGVDVYVPRNMDDKYSGAHFEQGYHHFNGEQALAFCRDRHTAYGDFTRSENQGRLMLATLAKMRSDVDDDSGLRRWLGVLLNHVELDVPGSEVESLAALLRRIDPSWLNNVVMPGKTGTASGGQSVVYPSEAAAAMWGDLRDDARLDTAPSSNGTGDPGGGEETPTTYPEDTTTTEPETTTTSRPPIIIGGGGGGTTTTTTTPDEF
jgi:LCP family protein required for cell wall assembly